MVGQEPLYIYKSDDPDVDAFDENTADYRTELYGLRQSDQAEHAVPMFLSRYAEEPDPEEFAAPLRKQRGASISARILAVVCGAAAVAILYALVSSDAARDKFANLEASIAGALPVPSAAAQLNPPQPRARDGQSKDSARPFAAENRAAAVAGVQVAAVSPSRDDIKAAYTSALQGGAPVPPAAAVAEPEPVAQAEALHRLDPGEVAASLKRAAALIASGDVAAARLVLRRPAETGEAQAAMILGETYDPAFLEKLNVHGVVPNIAAARGWYEKAKTFGAAEAAQRLDVLASRQQ
jgi:hypothetical protein